MAGGWVRAGKSQLVFLRKKKGKLENGSVCAHLPEQASLALGLLQLLLFSVLYYWLFNLSYGHLMHRQG